MKGRAARDRRRALAPSHSFLVGIIVLLGVVATLPSSAGASPSSVPVFFSRAPFSGTPTASVSAGTTCPGNFTISRPAFFSSSNGHFGTQFAVGSPGLQCDAVASFQFRTLAFNASRGGNAVFETRWWFAWAVNGTTRSPLAGHPAAASFDFSYQETLIDDTNLSVQQFSPTLASWSGFCSGNANFSATFNQSVRARDNVTVTHGHAYTIVLDMDFEIIGDSSLLTTDFSYVSATVGVLAHVTALKTISLG